VYAFSALYYRAKRVALQLVECITPWQIRENCEEKSKENMAKITITEIRTKLFLGTVKRKRTNVLHAAKKHDSSSSQYERSGRPCRQFEVFFPA
jgi:hypothetical protein